jgi:hypothetical protein
MSALFFVATHINIVRLLYMKSILILYFFLFISATFVFSQACDTCRVYVPNALTPDCDKFECEFLEIQSNCEMKEFKLEIYNRWGELVFESSDEKKRFDSSDVKDGVYLLKFQCLFCERKPYSYEGILNVIR